MLLFLIVAGYDSRSVVDCISKKVGFTLSRWRERVQPTEAFSEGWLGEGGCELKILSTLILTFSLQREKEIISPLLQWRE